MSTETAILLQSGVTQLTKLQSEIKQTKNVTDLPSYQELLSLLLKLLEKHQTKEDRLSFHTRLMEFQLTLIKDQLASTFVQNPTSPVLEKTLRGLNKALSTPRNLLFDENKRKLIFNAQNDSFISLANKQPTPSIPFTPPPTPTSASPATVLDESPPERERAEKKRIRNLFSSFSTRKEFVPPPPPPPNFHKPNPETEPNPRRSRSWSNLANDPRVQEIRQGLAQSEPNLSEPQSWSGGLRRALSSTKLNRARSHSTEEVPIFHTPPNDPEPEKKKGHRRTPSTATDEKKRKKEESTKKKFHKSLLKGAVEKKSKNGNLSVIEMYWLLEWSTQVKEEFETEKRSAIFALAYMCWPVERHIGWREKVIKSGLLLPFLEYAKQGLIAFHQEIDLNEIEMMESIAQGASAKVWKAKVRGKPMAIKVFDRQHIGFSIEEFRRELAIISILQHDCLVPCLGACTSSGKLMIASEIMTRGSLNNVLKDPKQTIDLTMTLCVARDTARGMKFLHSVGIIHRDLKSMNVLVNEEFQCKIIDFGTSRIIERTKIMTGNLGTPQWIAPEVLSNDKYSEKADVYSFGIVMWELLARTEPYKDMKIYDIPRAVIDGHRPPIPENANKDFVAIMKKCWSGNPEERPSFEELQHQFVNMISRIDNNGMYRED